MEVMKSLNRPNGVSAFTAKHNAGRHGTPALLLGLLLAASLAFSKDKPDVQTKEVLARVGAHDFHPVRDGFTFDRQLNKHGVASLDDQDWRVRTLAVRDLVRLGVSAAPALIRGLEDKSAHVRQVAAMVLGILRATDAIDALEAILRNDGDSVVRSQAAIALGQIGRRSSLAAVQAAHQDDKSKDVQHQAELAAYAIEHGMTATPELAKAYAALDESKFGRLRVGKAANDFQLRHRGQSMALV